MKVALTVLLVAVLLPGTGCRRPADEDQTSHVRSIDREYVPNTALGDRQTTTTDEATSDNSVSLPFEPPISMDPVDGSKVSIRADTPTTEYENRIYHFSSKENLELFLESPAEYAKGAMSTY